MVAVLFMIGQGLESPDVRTRNPYNCLFSRFCFCETLFTQGKNSMYAKPVTLNFTAYFILSKTIAGILINYKKKHL